MATVTGWHRDEGWPTIYPDRQMMLFAQDVLSRVPGGTILLT